MEAVKLIMDKDILQPNIFISDKKISNKFVTDSRTQYMLEHFVQCCNCKKITRKLHWNRDSKTYDNMKHVTCVYCGKGKYMEYDGLIKCPSCGNAINVKRNYKNNRLISEYCISCGFNIQK